MALIECIECGKSVSDKAISCPNCGAPISSNKLNSDDTNINEIKEKLLRQKAAYINRLLQNGWVLTIDNENGFSVQRTHGFSIGSFLLWALVLGFLGGIFLGIYGLLIALIIAIALSFGGKTETVSGTVLLKDEKLSIFCDGVHHKDVSIQDAIVHVPY